MASKKKCAAGPPGKGTASQSTPRKFRVEQNVRANLANKGPYAIQRILQPNDDVVIKRRFGEGTKPIFERDDIAINIKRPTVGNSTRSSNSLNTESREASPTVSLYHDQELSSSSSSSSSSPQRYHRQNTTHRKSREKDSKNAKSARERRHHYRQENSPHPPSRHTRPKEQQQPQRPRQRTPPTRRSVVERQKKDAKASSSMPYYADTKREEERIRRLYGSVGNEEDKSSSSRSRRKRSRSRSRSYSPAPRPRTVPANIFRLGGDRKHRPRQSRRSSSRDRRSSSRERNSNAATTAPLPAQHIIVPVPVPSSEFSYPYPAWHPTAWGAPPGYPQQMRYPVRLPPYGVMGPPPPMIPPPPGAYRQRFRYPSPSARYGQRGGGRFNYRPRNFN